MGEIKEGSIVEVSSEANGFYGVWYEAKVCYKASVLLSNQTFYLVEFQNPEKTVKHVSSNFIRPKPPTQTQVRFEVDDVVDAYFSDGWCIGKVVEQSEDYPTPHYSVCLHYNSGVINFKPFQLRHHLDWVDLTWVRMILLHVGFTGCFMNSVVFLR